MPTCRYMHANNTPLFHIEIKDICLGYDRQVGASRNGLDEGGVA